MVGWGTTRTSLATCSALSSALPATLGRRTAGTRGTAFVAVQFAIVVGVEFGERLGGVLDFLAGDYIVPVGIEGLENA